MIVTSSCRKAQSKVDLYILVSPRVILISLSDVFAAVQSSSTSYGVVPFENSTNGSVVYTLDLFADREKAYPDISVCGEVYLDVHHFLLGNFIPSSQHAAPSSGDATPTMSTPSPKKPRAQPLADIRHIKRIYSHPQAFGQCEAFLSTYLKGVERHEVSSTSKAAEIVSTDVSKTTSAISSKIAADVHGLDVLARGIEDRQDNTTRFFIIQKLADENAAKQSCSIESTDGGESSDWKSLVFFTIDHKSPGALADALMVFKTFGLNLTSINSRPSRIRPWHYIFFVEFRGRRERDGKGSVNQALEKLREASEDRRWLGSWENRVGVNDTSC